MSCHHIARALQHQIYHDTPSNRCNTVTLGYLKCNSEINHLEPFANLSSESPCGVAEIWGMRPKSQGFFQEITMEDSLGCPPSQVASHNQDHCIFRFGDPNLNLHLPLAYWEGGQSKGFVTFATHNCYQDLLKWRALLRESGQHLSFHLLCRLPGWLDAPEEACWNVNSTTTLQIL